MNAPAQLTARHATELARFGRLADLFDRAFRVPGTRWRFGWDAVLGLVPGAGDVAGAIFALYGIWLARRLGAPPVVQARMLLNIGIDLLVGAVPVAGDVFDAVFKAHVRNRQLLERWLKQPQSVARRSRALLIALPAAALALATAACGLAVWLFVACVRWVAGFF